MNPRKLLSTRLLDQEGKVGPFFFQEFLVIFLVLMSLFITVLIGSLFFPIHGTMLILIPGIFMVVVGIARFLFKHRITSPWYLHQWIARKWIRPQHLVPGTWDRKSSLIWAKKH